MAKFKEEIEKLNSENDKKYYFAEHPRGLTIFYVLEKTKFTLVIADSQSGVTSIGHDYDKKITEITNKETFDILTLSGYMFPEAHLIDEDYYVSIMKNVNTNMFNFLFSEN